MRACEVFVHGKFAGILSETDNPKQYVFKYDESYIDSPTNVGVSLSMPVRKEEYRSGSLFPYFANLISEGENREIQSALLHIDKNDDFGFLLATANFDTVGAVTVKRIE